MNVKHELPGVNGCTVLTQLNRPARWTSNRLNARHATPIGERKSAFHFKWYFENQWAADWRLMAHTGMVVNDPCAVFFLTRFYRSFFVYIIKQPTTNWRKLGSRGGRLVGFLSSEPSVENKRCVCLQSDEQVFIFFQPNWVRWATTSDSGHANAEFDLDLVCRRTMKRKDNINKKPFEFWEKAIWILKWTKNSHVCLKH